MVELQKAKTFKDGVYKLSYKFNTPIIPCFITMQDSVEFKDGDGLPVQEYTINIFPAIYPDLTKTANEEITRMKELNFKLCKECYEKTYKIPLSYNLKKDNK